MELYFSFSILCHGFALSFIKSLFSVFSSFL